MTAVPKPRKDKIVAGLLALFLGSFGIHHFYLGNIIRGALYLVFCWTGITAVLGLIEGIYYLTRSDSAWFAKYPSSAVVIEAEDAEQRSLES